MAASENDATSHNTDNSPPTIRNSSAKILINTGSHFTEGESVGFTPQSHSVTNNDYSNGAFQEKVHYPSDGELSLLMPVREPQNNPSMHGYSESSDPDPLIGSQINLIESSIPQNVYPIQYLGNVNVDEANMRQIMAAQLNDIAQAIVKHEDINFAFLMFQSIKDHAGTLIDLESTKRPTLGPNPPTSNYGTSSTGTTLDDPPYPGPAYQQTQFYTQSTAPGTNPTAPPSDPTFDANNLYYPNYPNP